MNKIYPLYNHYGKITTVVVGEYCIRGSQTFHIEDAFGVFNEFNVKQQCRDHVLELFDKYNPNEPFDIGLLDELSELFVNKSEMMVYKKIISLLLKHYNSPELLNFIFNHPDENIVILGLDYYTTEQKDELLVCDKAQIRQYLAIRGDAKYLNILEHDEDEDVRVAVVFRLNENQLDILVNHENYEVRLAVCKLGYKKHLDILVHDVDSLVRAEVARHGHEEHLDILVHDVDSLVRVEVAKHGYKEHLDELVVNDVSEQVQLIITGFGIKEHLDVLVNSPYEEVRKTVAKIGNKNAKHTY